MLLDKSPGAYQRHLIMQLPYAYTTPLGEERALFSLILDVDQPEMLDNIAEQHEAFRDTTDDVIGKNMHIYAMQMYTRRGRS